MAESVGFNVGAIQGEGGHAHFYIAEFNDIIWILSHRQAMRICGLLYTKAPCLTSIVTLAGFMLWSMGAMSWMTILTLLLFRLK